MIVFRTLKKIQKTSIFILIVLGVLIFNSTISFALLPFTEKDLDYLLRDQHYRDSESLTDCRVGALPSQETSFIYLVGDSWLAGLNIGGQDIQQSLRERGFTIVGNNYVVGRSISGGGAEDQSGMEALEADSALIQTADTVIVALGTNADNYDQRIPQFMDKLRGKTVFWVNTAANATQSITTNASAANTAIQKHSTGDVPYTVVDWFSLAFPGGDATNIDPNATSPLMASDRIHPKNPEGYAELKKLITNTVSAGGGSGESGGVGGATRSSLPEIARERLATVEAAVERNKAAYEAAAAQTDIPWQVIAALHYRETGNSRTNPTSNDDGLFQIESLSFTPGLENTDSQITEQAVTAMNFLKSIVDSVYDITLTSSSSFADFQHAFLAYNRGSLYKNVPIEEGGPWSPDLSPYVMNLYDAEHLGSTGTGMEFPVGTSGARSGTTGGKRWGETVSGKNNPAGAMTFLAYFGLSTPGAETGTPCVNGEVTFAPGQLAWPVTNGGTITACWSDLRHKTVSGGEYYHSGIDIAAGSGEEVRSVQSGEVVFAGSHSAYGNLVIIDHKNGVWTHYGHLSSINSEIKIGEQVVRGEAIGAVGNTGISRGDHLHFNMYNKWPFGALPEGAAHDDGTQSINPLTHGLAIPSGVVDEARCTDYPDGGREVSIDL